MTRPKFSPRTIIASGLACALTTALAASPGYAKKGKHDAQDDVDLMDDDWEWTPDQAETSPPPTPDVDTAQSSEPIYQTTDLVMATSLGEITIALEMERAPITAANFLKYAQEGRFDGTVFYRAMHLKWGEPPNGLLQGGTRNDPKRILPPIAHEPTTLTGLRHTRGALSMARFDPGTATGDFSIMIKDLPGLDANPKAEDASQQAGFAVFGYVTSGMDVVEAIFNAPIDPNKGEGWMKGQMLANPAPILSLRVIEKPVSETPAIPMAETLRDAAGASESKNPGSTNSDGESPDTTGSTPSTAAD